MTKRIYLAGPMRGIEDFNFPAFHAAADELRKKGFEVFNPAEHDEEKYGINFNVSRHGDLNEISDSGFNLRETLNADVTWITNNADAIALLPGWEHSKGATAGRALGVALGLEIILLGNQSGEQRVTDPSTGGQKGVKLERFDLIPVFPLEEVARVYGTGAKKYAEDNWRKGYSWRLTFGALMRHAWSFWRGESIDKETGCHHLASVVWHCFTLMTFEKNNLGTDDRADK